MYFCAHLRKCSRSLISFERYKGRTDSPERDNWGLREAW
jgi:hypothetical protein